MPEFHAEPYLLLAEVTHKAALIAWGAFYFRVSDHDEGGAWKLVQERDLKHVYPPRHETIGARSEPYGDARVEVRDMAGNVVAAAGTSVANHVWVRGLLPDQEYTYRVVVNDEEWAAGERRDWVVEEHGQGLRRSGRHYENRFRTHPHPEESAPLTFAVLGDFGVGVRRPSSSTRRQREVADALEAATNRHGVRLVLTTGDNIYAGKAVLGFPIAETGDEDSDWFFTYYQPYRYLLNRIPVYPSVGNHDTNETERSDDRLQLEDNFFLRQRFGVEEATGRATLEPGLFYRIGYGADVEFVCVDTSKRSILPGDRMFQRPEHRAFLEAAFPEPANPAVPPRWRIPFGHHPPYCAGPVHYNSRSLIEQVVPLFARAGVRAVFSGHEHNFQHQRTDGIDYFITGAGGKLRTVPPLRFAAAHNKSWAAAGHFLLVSVNGGEMTVRPMAELGPGGEERELQRRAPDGSEVTGPVVIA